MTPMERVLTTLSHEEPDRVPLFLLLTTQGAKEFNVSIEEYFSNPEMVAQGQIKMQHKYGHDCYYPFYYASLEMEAWGSNSIFYPDGPPNSGRPILRDFQDIVSLEAPDVFESLQLQKVLKTTEIIKEHAGEDIPIIGVVMSPFSLPTMQMGFGNYLDLIYEQPDIFNELMRINEQFCIQWANAQIESGATAICYFDPVSSSTIIPPELYRDTGFKVAKRTIFRINGPTATHMASGRCLPIINDIAETGTAVICTSVLEDLAEMKAVCKGKMTVLGNLNGLEMRHWTRQETEDHVKDAIQKAATGGGYIISDNHGEIPYPVPSEVLKSVSEYVEKWGRYR
ncbi:uroporphyrinogen decarboxylase family protein [Methanolobus mangrovi]|uniref:Uroporphyrinogen decarboxylase family protein n=1 Tax=Methanolobus mangrovi TaxID=3072977 RepID=A0AA51UDG9_9EURY|nr:uroporphyrinogen decarboxylase family protein [Methanolobus mangrovi]WMW21126.1 uroporphyrinogen decarboxylase family protein [Methanolobus mangrovi]